MSRRIVFESSAFADFNDWAKLDKKIQRKIIELIIDRHPRNLRNYSNTMAGYC